MSNLKETFMRPGARDIEKPAQAEHSPLPWGLEIATDSLILGQRFQRFAIVTPERVELARTSGLNGSSSEANAQLIVEACNNYARVKAERDELLAACKRLCDLCDRNEIMIPTHELRVIGEASAAIAKAEGRE